jgi:hypothetical protein
MSIGSFLIFIHEKASLAATITKYFEKIAQEAPLHSPVRTPPGFQTIRGMLQACEDQTAAYKWHWRMQLLAVAATLAVDESEINQTIPPVILHGLMSMLPLAQHFPEDRCIVVETPRGACNIAVWAHILLGLRVLVRLYSGEQCVEVRFPQSEQWQRSEQVLVNVRNSGNLRDQNQDSQPSISLLSTSTREQLFKLKADPDEDVIEANFKRPAEGLARRILDKETPPRTGKERILEEMMYISCSLAFRIAEKLSTGSTRAHVDFSNAESVDEDNNPDTTEGCDRFSYHVPTQRIIDATCMLFNMSNRKFSSKVAEQYASLYTGMSCFDILDAPSSISAIFDEWSHSSKWKGSSDWPVFRDIAMQLSVLILAFSHVTNLDSCRDMPLCELPALIGQSALCAAIVDWDGKSQIVVNAHVWFEIIGLMMIGQTGDTFNLQATCLISGGGWSLYLNTFGDSDPSFIGMSISCELLSYYDIDSPQ